MEVLDAMRYRDYLLKLKLFDEYKKQNKQTTTTTTTTTKKERKSPT